MPQKLTTRALEISHLDWLVNQSTTMHALAGSGVPDRTWSAAQFAAGELIEGGPNNYSRTNIKPAAVVTPAFDPTDDRNELAEQTFVAAIPQGQVWAYRWTGSGRNTTAWANRPITTVAVASDTVSFPANGGMFATGQQVIITADAGGALPGGVTAMQVYTLQGVTGTTTITASLRAIGSSTNLDITSAGSGTLRVRSVPELVFTATVEDSEQSASGTLSFISNYAAQAV